MPRATPLADISEEQAQRLLEDLDLPHDLFLYVTKRLLKGASYRGIIIATKFEAGNDGWDRVIARREGLPVSEEKTLAQRLYRLIRERQAAEAECQARELEAALERAMTPSEALPDPPAEPTKPQPAVKPEPKSAMTSSDQALRDWITTYGSFKARKDKHVSKQDWIAMRTKAAGVAFPDSKLTRDGLRRIGRSIGPGFA